MSHLHRLSAPIPQETQGLAPFGGRKRRNRGSLANAMAGSIHKMAEMISAIVIPAGAWPPFYCVFMLQTFMEHFPRLQVGSPLLLEGSAESSHQVTQEISGSQWAACQETFGNVCRCLWFFPI